MSIITEPLIAPEDLIRTGSNFHKITVAFLRWKQLTRGADPRVEPDKSRRKNTTIAIEEVRQGKILFSKKDEEE
ncbi:MAG: DNA-directed RNA polymerase subunit omega [Acidobacteria bacterium]|nr:DNA-directed RNA polymerase subunit omega [Acidobacteriota bacterium]